MIAVLYNLLFTHFITAWLIIAYVAILGFLCWAVLSEQHTYSRGDIPLIIIWPLVVVLAFVSYLSDKVGLEIVCDAIGRVLNTYGDWAEGLLTLITYIPNKVRKEINYVRYKPDKYMEELKKKCQ